MPVKKKKQAKKSFWARAAKAVVYAFLCLCFFLFGLDLALQYLLPLESVKKKITQNVTDAVKMDITVTDVRGGLRGVSLRGLIAGDANGPLLSIDNLRLRLSPLQLLKGRVVVSGIFIDGLAVQITRAHDGGFNFDKFLSSAPAAPESGGKPSSIPAVISVSRLQVTNSAVSYIDRAEQIDARAEKLFIDIDDFSLNKPFALSLNAQLFAAAQGKEIVSGLPLGVSLQPDLSGLDLDKAAMEIKNIVLRRAGSDLIIAGNITNFNNPDIKLEMQIKKLVPAAFAPLEMPDFEIPLITMSAKINADLKADTAALNNIDIAFLNSKINIKGLVNYGAEPLKYNLNIAAMLGLEGFSPAIVMLREYKPKGKLAAQAAVTQDDVKGNIVISDAGAHLPQAGALRDVEIKIEAASIKDIKTTEFKGKLNGHPFRGGASFLNKGAFADVNVFFKAETLLARMDAPSITPAKPDEEVKPLLPAESAPQPMFWPLPPLNIRADVDIKNLDTHFLSGTNILFKANMKDVTPELNKTQGALSLTAEKGRIKDLYRLTNANAVTKVLFVSLGVISKVINTLDVLSVLKAVSGAAVSAVKKKAPPEEGETIPPEKLSGVLDYDIFNTALNFQNGVSKIEQINFASDKLSFKVTGDIDFNTRKLNMTVNAAPGNVKEGIMPLAIKIGGTVEEPKGSLSMLSSTAALVSQSLLNNPASNLIKGGIGGLGGILGIGKKKEKNAPDEYIPLEPAPAQ